LVYSWKRRRVYETYLVETGVVDAHPKHPAAHGDEQLFVHFTDEILSLNGLLLGLLLDWSGIGVDFKMMLNHLPRDLGRL
jgi:hypothetical protein